MNSGPVRLLRVAPSTETASIDGVVNPALLAHQLLDLQSIREEQHYARKLRLSGIAGVCVREQLLGIRNDLQFRRHVDLAMHLTFAIGNGIHDFLQNGTGYLGTKRLGWWRCSACGFKYFGRQPLANCRKCSALPGAIRYQEHALRLPDDIPVSGHPDMFLEVTPGDIRVLDFKSINGEEFKKLTTPLADHALQVVGYMEYLQHDVEIPVRVNPNKGIVLYVSKKQVVNDLPFKAFHVSRNQAFESLIRAKVADFKRGLDDPLYLPPPLQKCVAVAFQSGTAKWCPASALCEQLCN